MALSNGESEFYVTVRGTATAFSMKSTEGATREFSVVMGAGSFPQARSNDLENPRTQQRSFRSIAED